MADEAEPIAYPVRCRVVDVTGAVMDVEGGSLGLRTPDVSKPYIGRKGLAEEVGEDVRITLDGGEVLWGWECWWVPLSEDAEAQEKA
jgi:hypothetical protein